MRNFGLHHIVMVMRRHLIVGICLLGLALTAGSGRADSKFVSGFDDLPLMPGMSELAGELMTFDSPTGRIVENSVQGNVEAQAALRFYRTTLPQLGWIQTGPQIFSRENEILKLEFLSPEGVSSSLQANRPSSLIVRFNLFPADK